MRRYKSVLPMLICILLAQFSFGQMRQVKFDQLDSLQRIENKIVVVFIHTSWCKFCTTMKQTTFKNDNVIQLLNKQFYFVSFDVEEKDDIIFGGHIFKYKPTGLNTGVHELAEQLGSINGVLAYPGISFLNTKNEIIYQKEGYTSSKDILLILSQMKTFAQL